MENKQLTWKGYRIMDESDLESALERFQLRMHYKPSRAMISTRCPQPIAEMIRKRLEKIGITEMETSNYPLPNDLWLTDGQKGENKTIKQKSLFETEQI